MVIPPPPPPPPPPKNNALGKSNWGNQNSCKSNRKRTTPLDSMLNELKDKMGKHPGENEHLKEPTASTSKYNTFPEDNSSSLEVPLPPLRIVSSKHTSKKRLSKQSLSSKVQRVDSQTKDVKSESGDEVRNNTKYKAANDTSNGVRNLIKDKGSNEVGNVGRNIKKVVEDKTRAMEDATTDLAREKAPGFKDSVKSGSQKMYRKLKDAMVCCVPKNEDITTPSNVSLSAPIPKRSKDLPRLPVEIAHQKR